MKLIKDKKDVFTIPNMLSAFRIILAAVFLCVFFHNKRIIYGNCRTAGIKENRKK